jgi:predicted acyl esterase
MLSTFGDIQVVHSSISTPEKEADTPYEGLNPSRTILPVGHKRSARSRRFSVGTIYERDVAVPLRDGVLLRADVFRPVGFEKVPALLVYSPYGKAGVGK